MLGEEIRFDHQVLLNKAPGSAEQDYHTHEYADAKVPFTPVGPAPWQHGGLSEMVGGGEGLMSAQELTGHRYRNAGQLDADGGVSVDDPALGYIRVFFYATGCKHTRNPSLLVILAYVLTDFLRLQSRRATVT